MILTTATDVTTLVSQLACAADTAVIDDLLTDLRRQLCFREDGWLGLYTASGALATLSATFNLDTDIGVGSTVFKLLSIAINGRDLEYVDRAQLDSDSATWRDELGMPVAFTSDYEDDRTFRYVPQPDSGATGLRAFVTNIVPSTLPRYLVLPLALLVLARELSRSSRAYDAETATVAETLGNNLLEMVR